MLKTITVDMVTTSSARIWMVSWEGQLAGHWNQYQSLFVHREKADKMAEGLRAFSATHRNVTLSSTWLHTAK